MSFPPTMQSSFAVDSITLHRIEGVLEHFFPTVVGTFQELLIQTGAHIMGSLPLFSMKPAWENWAMPGDCDIYLAPTIPAQIRSWDTSIADERMIDNIRQFYHFLGANGYDSPGEAEHEDGYPYPERFWVRTFTNTTRGAPIKVQLILPSDFSSLSHFWHLEIMYTFDITICCVGYDGRAFHVTSDNSDPAFEIGWVRRYHHTTPERIMKYEQRGFRITNPFARFLPIPLDQ